MRTDLLYRVGKRVQTRLGRQVLAQSADIGVVGVLNAGAAAFDEELQKQRSHLSVQRPSFTSHHSVSRCREAVGSACCMSIWEREQKRQEAILTSEVSGILEAHEEAAESFAEGRARAGVDGPHVGA